MRRSKLRLRERQQAAMKYIAAALQNSFVLRRSTRMSRLTIFSYFLVIAILVSGWNTTAQIIIMPDFAPVIGDIPSPVIGDRETATPANTFVFPDAIDLTAYITDKNADGSNNPPSNIIWSYEIIGQPA